MPPVPTPLPENSRSSRRAGILQYSIGLVLVQVVLLGLAFAVGTTRWFLTHCYSGMLQSGYSLRLNHEDCEILIYGDSSTLTGLDPAIIQQMTGLKTCNISEGSTVTNVVGTRYPLDQYLAHNKRPRFLLEMYTSSMYRPDTPPFYGYSTEGMAYAFRYERTPQFMRRLLRKPAWPLKFAVSVGEQVINYFVARYVFQNHSLYTDTRAQRDSRHGIWPYHFPPETHCTRLPVTEEIVGRHADQVASMRQRYGVDGTTVILNISPVPNCDLLYPLYSRLANGLHDNAFERLPISYFNQGDVHFSPQGSRYISIEAGNEILAAERQQNAARRATSGVAP